MITFNSLPAEVRGEVASYLPVRSLLAFGQTSRINYLVHRGALEKLRLGVFPTKVTGIVSFFEARDDEAIEETAYITLDEKVNRTRDTIIRNQNAEVAKITGKYKHTLRELDVSLWSFDSKAAEAVLSLEKLQHLSVRLDHSNTRHPDVKPSFWKTSPPSTVWNSLYASETETGLTGLRSLSLERAGITDYQLQKIIEQNPNLKELQLRKCLTLTNEFFEFLANSEAGKRIETLHFTHSNNPLVNEEILPHISKMPKLKSFSLYECFHIENGKVEEFNKEWKIPKVTMPTSSSLAGGAIEVDPAYK